MLPPAMHPPLPLGLAPPPRLHTCICLASMPMCSGPAFAYLQHHLWPFYGHPRMHDDIMQPLPWLCPLASPMLSAMPFGPACPWTYDIHSSSASMYAWRPWCHLWPCAPHDVTMHHLRLMASPMTCPPRCHLTTPWYHHTPHDDIIRHHYNSLYVMTDAWHHNDIITPPWHHPDSTMTRPRYHRSSATRLN